jgi:hypothetical protein
VARWLGASTRPEAPYTLRDARDHKPAPADHPGHSGQRRQGRWARVGGHVHEPFAQRRAFGQERPGDRSESAGTSENPPHMVMRPQSEALEARAVITHVSPLFTNRDLGNTNITSHRVTCPDAMGHSRAHPAGG